MAFQIRSLSGCGSDRTCEWTIDGKARVWRYSIDFEATVVFWQALLLALVDDWAVYWIVMLGLR